MQLNNPLQINDWEIKKFLKVVLAIQLALWAVIGLDAIGLQIPIIRQLIGFIYLTFIPGIIILRILKLHKLGNIETLLYTVGLSIATLMFTGLFMNTVYPLFGISGPISLVPLVITISAIVLVLCVLCYMRDKDFSNPSFIDIKNVLSSPALFLCLIPFLSIFGTYLVNFYQNNILLMLLIVIIAIIAILIGFDRGIPKSLYPLAIFIIAISLLYHRSLISMYLWGWDIQVECYLCNLVRMNGIWDSTIPYSFNAMLSIVMVAPIYSNILSMDIAWVFKIIYQLVFSLVPLGLYRVFQKQTDDKIAFLSCFFFVSIQTFFSEMPQLARQQIAELFLVLLILSMIDKNMDKIKRSFLFIVFGISLAVSHYGLSYIYMFSLISAWLIMLLMDNPAIQKLRDDFYVKFSRYKREKLARNPISLNAKNRTISSTFVLLFITFTLTWYMYVSSSSAFNSIVRIGDHMASSIFTDFLNPEAAEGLDIIMRETVSPLHSVTKYLHLLFQFFIAVGVLTLLIKGREMKFEDEHTSFSIVNLVICFGAIGLPYFAIALHTTRLYQITLIFLAPFCVIGGITVFRIIHNVIKVSWTNKSVRNSLRVLSVLLAILLLFNTGFVYEVTKDNPGSIALSQESSTKDYPLTNEQEALSGEWLRDNRDTDTTIYADEYRGLSLAGTAHIGDYRVFWEDEEMTTRIHDNAYIFLGRENVKNKKIILITPIKRERKPVDLQNLTFYNTLLNSSIIYNNGDAHVYYR